MGSETYKESRRWNNREYKDEYKIGSDIIIENYDPKE